MNRIGRKRQLARSLRYDMLLITARLLGVAPDSRPKTIGAHHIAMLETKIRSSRGHP